MRVLLLGLLLMAGCAAPKQPNSSESLAEEKRRAHAQRVKDNEKQNEELRKAVAQVYVRNHPALSSGIQKAIMHGRIKTGMTPWDVIASYALWEYTTDPGWAAYRAAGTVPLWALAGRRQIRSGTVPQEEWVLQREREMQYLYFEHGKLAKWKD